MITCVNQTKSGSRLTLLSTEGGKTVRDNISCLYGPKQLVNILEIMSTEPDDEILQEMAVKIDEKKNVFKLEGYISSCEYGCGRSSTDRQFCYINSRPCDVTKVIRLVNEIYHQFNKHQYPFVFLNIKVKKTSIDVNVTPDKRMIFLEHEKLLLATIKSTLLKMYESIPSTYRMNVIAEPVLEMKSVTEQAPSFHASLNRFRSVRDKMTTPCSTVKREMTETGNCERVKQMKLDKAFVYLDKSNDSSSNDLVSVNSNLVRQITTTESTNICDNILVNDEAVTDNSISRVELSEKKEDSKIKLDHHHHINDVESSQSIIFAREEESSVSEQKITDEYVPFYKNNVNSDACFLNEVDVVLNAADESPKVLKNDSEISSSAAAAVEETIHRHDDENNKLNNFEEDNVNDNSADNVATTRVIVDDMAVINSHKNRRCIQLDISVDGVEKILQDKWNREKTTTNNNNINLQEQRCYVNKFHYGVDPRKSHLAELELTKEITKDMFAEMKIIGQFNLGFIITRLESDLFIIDQHATDEKYNFEMLQKNTILQNQKLVIPQRLELTVMSECTLLDNLDILKKNGFEFEIDESAEPTKRVKLVAIPVSHNWQFGKSDVEELIFMLQDAPNTLCRPSRVRSMFASRACRKSVMIGTALSYSDMRRIVNHMGEIEQPWNCPHGRPTMRHLINLSLLQ